MRPRFASEEFQACSAAHIAQPEGEFLILAAEKGFAFGPQLDTD
jgi:hypothetical protein